MTQLEYLQNTTKELINECEDVQLLYLIENLLTQKEEVN